MKNLFFLLLLFTGIVKAQIITIPDAFFKAKLLTSTTSNNVAQNSGGFGIKIDANDDGEIEVSEVLPIWTLTVSMSNIVSLQGIQSFINLKNLFANNMQMTTLDISSLTSLQLLNVSNNPLTSLNVTGCTGLLNLTCYFCQLPALDVLSCTNLNNISCYQNNLTSLDVSGLTNLMGLDCNFNQITSLNTSGCSGMTSLLCSSNQLTTLDVSTLTALTGLICSINQLTTLDVSNLINLTTLNCESNQLLTLFIKNGSNETLTYGSNPNLHYICADDSQINDIITNISYNTAMVLNVYCSVPPGGNYNTITGTMLFDADNNGCDALDIAQPFIKVKINDGVTQGATFISSTGNYTFYTPAGNYTITPDIESSILFNVSPANAVVNFPLTNNSVSTQNFCITANGVHPDLEVVLVTIVRARPGFDATYKLVYKNKGNQLLSGAVNLAFDDAKTDFVSAVPTVNTQVINSLTWNFSNLAPFETRVINFALNINSPTETPAVIAGDILNFTATINPVTGDELPSDNVFNLNQTVVNSLDPNDKTCLEGNTVSPSEIGNYVHYNINFENIGTENALNIVVKDIIDNTKFDISSLQLMYASHPVSTKISGNVVEFVFQGINLPPSAVSPIGGHGNVLFKIKTKPTLVDGDIITNTANIFFDYNAPITTNEAKTTFALLNTADFIRDNSVSVYPNPAKNNITISAKNNIKSIQFFDVQRRILQTVIENKNTVKLDVSNKANGVYFLKITTEDGISVEKVVKE